MGNSCKKRVLGHSPLTIYAESWELWHQRELSPQHAMGSTICPSKIIKQAIEWQIWINLPIDSTDFVTLPGKHCWSTSRLCLLRCWRGSVPRSVIWMSGSPDMLEILGIFPEKMVPWIAKVSKDPTLAAMEQKDWWDGTGSNSASLCEKVFSQFFTIFHMHFPVVLSCKSTQNNCLPCSFEKP